MALSEDLPVSFPASENVWTPQDLEWARFTELKLDVLKQLKEGIFPHARPYDLSGNPKAFLNIQGALSDYLKLPLDALVTEPVSPEKTFLPVSFGHNADAPNEFGMVKLEQQFPLLASLVRVTMPDGSQRDFRYDQNVMTGHGVISEVHEDDELVVHSDDEQHQGVEFYRPDHFDRKVFTSLLIDTAYLLFGKDDFPAHCDLSLSSIKTPSGMTFLRVKILGEGFEWIDCTEWLRLKKA